LSTIISRRIYNQWRDLTPESAISRTEGEVERQLRVSTVRLHPSELSKVHRLHTHVRLQLYQPRRSPEDSKINKGNWINSNNPDPGNSKSVKSNKPSEGSRANYNQRRGSERKSAKAERQTGNALAAAAETTKPYMPPWLRYNRTESP